MKWVKDTTGRFPQRPHYERSELDQECEALITAFLRARYGVANFPVDTNDLTILIEQEVDDGLDLYADLSKEGQDVEGITEFFRDRKPKVRIARELTEQEHRENRFRTTLTHEFGHVKFHGFLVGLQQTIPMPGFGDGRVHVQRCKRETVLGAKQSDWMEWQAGYISGAILMPITPLRRLVQQVLEEVKLFSPVSLKSTVAENLIYEVQSGFRVSADAARVRLLQTGHLVEYALPGSLFAPD